MNQIADHIRIAIEALELENQEKFDACLNKWSNRNENSMYDYLKDVYPESNILNNDAYKKEF